MTNNGLTRGISGRGTGVLILAFAFSCLCGARAEDAQARAERLGGLVESLNGGYRRREEVSSQIYNEMRGENAAEMRAALKEGLFHGNLLVQLGVVESLAMFGDPGDVDDLETVLNVSDRFEVKTSILRLLPAFLLHNNERGRLAFLRHIHADKGADDVAALAPLRKPPLTRRGRYDAGLDDLALRISRMMVRQFDPIAAAIAYVNDPVLGEAARAAVLRYTGSRLGNDPTLWGGIWATLADDLNLSNRDEIEEIHLGALAALADLAAEGTAVVLEGFETLLEFDSAIITHAAMDALVHMCRFNYEKAGLVMSGDFGIADGAGEDGWRERNNASAVRLGVFTADRALRLVASVHPEIETVAVEALGAACSYPGSLPDPGGLLAEKRAEAVSTLTLLAMSPETPSAMRLAVLRALGEIGSARAVDVVREILASPYAAPEREADGLATAEASVAALARIAVEGRDGAPEARRLLLALLRDERRFASPKPEAPPIQMGHIVMWRLQRIAKLGSVSLEPEFWANRLGW